MLISSFFFLFLACTEPLDSMILGFPREWMEEQAFANKWNPPTWNIYVGYYYYKHKIILLSVITQGQNLQNKCPATHG